MRGVLVVAVLLTSSLFSCQAIQSGDRTHDYMLVGGFLPEGSGGVRRGGGELGYAKFVEDTTSLGGVGWYANMKVGGDFESAENHYDNSVVRQFGDPEVDRHRVTGVLNVGATWMFKRLPNVGAYAGVGVGWWSEKIELDDPTNILGDTYTVEGPDDAGVNGNFGFLAALNSGIGAFVEYDTFPDAFSFGVAFRF